MADRLSLDHIDILQTLGTGTYGRVRLAYMRDRNQFIALKILKKLEIIRHKQVDHVISEHSILQMINHPFLVNLLGFTQDNRYLYFALEYVPGGELFSYLRNLGKIDNVQTRFYAAQMTLMFEYLHSLNIVYRDLKPENLLIAPDGYLKLTDFGFSKVVEGRTYTLCGTPEYFAPEILLNKGHGKPVDWWTLGIIIYEMLAGIDPFNDEDPMVVYQKILKGKIKFPRGFDKGAKSLVKHLLVADLTKRYGNMRGGVNDIKNHKWFASIDWYKLRQREIEMPYRPFVHSPDDTSNFSNYPDSATQTSSISPRDDPFLEW
ncbi:unnamed protein product [Blepharisma stoltei]|uniref:cAMP-dependent protein kinase catalytic subunit n=1 Tax=Blepharisma stoltei TaxID=1481888 RepID=A0AAU9J119_9CILI|nr:unnamed protein product [Blepharisma stoltei]